MRHRESPATNGAPSENVQDDGPHEDTTRHALAAEVALVGAMAQSSEARTHAVRMIDPGDFTREAHRVLFATICELHAEGSPVDNITINDRLIETGKLDEAGGLVGIFDCTSLEGCPIIASWPTYATIVAREARRRRGITKLTRAIERLEAGEDPAVVAGELGAVA